LILPKYKIDCYAKLNCILLINIAGVYLKISKSIGCSLICAALYLPLLSLAYSLTYVCTNLNILKDNLVFSLGIREYCISRDIAAGRFAKGDLAVKFALQEAYKRYG